MPVCDSGGVFRRLSYARQACTGRLLLGQQHHRHRNDSRYLQEPEVLPAPLVISTATPIWLELLPALPVA